MNHGLSHERDHDRIQQEVKMSNMSHCRFHNTAQDLEDCYEHLQDDDLSALERKARLKIIQLCKNILYDVRIGVEMNQEPEFD